MFGKMLYVHNRILLLNFNIPIKDIKELPSFCWLVYLSILELCASITLHYSGNNRFGRLKSNPNNVRAYASENEYIRGDYVRDETESDKLTQKPSFDFETYKYELIRLFAVNLTSEKRSRRWNVRIFERRSSGRWLREIFRPHYKVKLIR